jgi:GNAT superfamily N-acetyltransferase
MPIRLLDPSEAPLVAAFYRAAPDYWLLAEGACDPDRQATEFFTDGPPDCDLSLTHHLGLFLPHGDGLSLSGVAEVSYGFPLPTDAYLGLMLLGPWARGAGHGKALLTRAEALARGRGARRMLLAVLEANPRGRAFWEREGFRPTGLSRDDPVTGHTLHRLMKPL